MSVRNRTVIVFAVLMSAVAACLFFNDMAKADGCGIDTAASCEFIIVQEPATDGEPAGQAEVKDVKYRIDYIDGVEVQRAPADAVPQVAGVQSWTAEPAANTVSTKLEQLRVKYPDSYYWNHEITAENAGETVNGTWIETWNDEVTSHPCNHEFDKVGQYGCNAFDHGIACWGFANKVFYDVFGIRAYSEERLYDVDNIAVGDHVRFNYTHSAIVLSRNGNRITLLECNYNSNCCQIRWDRIDTIQNVLWYQHADNWEKVNKQK